MSHIHWFGLHWFGLHWFGPPPASGLLMLAILGVLPEPASAHVTPAGMQPAEIVDATGFEAPIAASTLFIPQGWRTQGGVLWGSEYLCTNGYTFNWSAESADGLTTVAVLPQTNWEWNNYGAGPSAPGCQIASYTNVTQYLDALVQYWRPGARVLEHRPRDELERDFAQLNAVAPMPLGESRTWVEAGEVAFTFQSQGRHMRGTVAAVVVFSLLRTNTGSGVMEALSANAFPAYGTAAPDSQHDARLFETIRRSITTNPRWEARIANHNAGIAHVAIEEGRKRSEIIARSNEEVARIQQETWQNSQASAERRARMYNDALRGVEPCNCAHTHDGSYPHTHGPGIEPCTSAEY